MSLSLEDTWELLRSGLPCWVLVSVIVLGAHVSSVGGMQDFSVYRMQHFDLHGLHYGQCSGVGTLHTTHSIAQAGLASCTNFPYFLVSFFYLLPT